jgi:5-methylthioribose kinase
MPVAVVDRANMNDALNIEQPDALLRYLRDTGRLGPSEVPTLTTLAGGVSNRTVLLESPNGKAWVLKQALAKLRVAEDWFCDPQRIHREALGLAWLERLTPPGSIPSLLFEDETCHLLAMRAVPRPHENWKNRLLAGEVQREHVTQFGQLLGIIHREAHRRREEIAPLFADRRFFESLRLEPYYQFTAQRHREVAHFLSDLMAETLATRLTLVHGDYSPKNVLLRDGQLVLLDHEVIHFGDPAFDLGFGLTHFLSKAHHLPQHRSAFMESAHCFWQTYERTVGELVHGAELEARVVRHTLACMLARVDGRSPLEYLTEAQRNRQRQITLSLMPQPPRCLSELLPLLQHGFG